MPYERLFWPCEWSCCVAYVNLGFPLFGSGEWISGHRYFSVTRPVLTSVTGAVNGAQGPSYPHGNTITVSAQLTALTNSARHPSS